MWIGDREGEAEGEEADLKKGMKDQKSGGRRSGPEWPAGGRPLCARVSPCLDRSSLRMAGNSSHRNGDTKKDCQ